MQTIALMCVHQHQHSAGSVFAQSCQTLLIVVSPEARRLPMISWHVQVLTKVIKSGTSATQLRATDVMLSAIQHDPAPLRHFMRSQKDHELFHLLVRSASMPQTKPACTAIAASKPLQTTLFLKYACHNKTPRACIV